MIQLASIFQDGMILQRNKPLKFWGTSSCAQELSVYMNGTLLLHQKVNAGKFCFVLPPQPETEDASLCIAGSGGDELLLNRVDIGEVWIAGGQSNMEFLLRYDREGGRMTEEAYDPHFRYYDTAKYSFEGEELEQVKDASHWNRWMTFTPQDAPWFSAAAVYFALKLREQLGVPVGIVGCNWGATRASSWIARDMLEASPLLSTCIRDYDKAVRHLDLDQYLEKDLQARKAAVLPEAVRNFDIKMKEEAAAPPSRKLRLTLKLNSKLYKTGPHDPNRPGCLYETMVKKICGYACAGVIWYQGEADDFHADIYSEFFRHVIRCWRDAWNDRLPFLFVQLAPFQVWRGCEGTRYPVLRQQQQIIEDTQELAWMASIMDAGSRYDLHPKEKRPAGERLALLALGKIYHQDCCCEAPRLKHIDVQDGALIVSFTGCGSGLVAKGDISPLFVCRKNGRKIRIRVSLEHSTVTITKERGRLKGKLCISFAYAPYVKMTLYNSAGLAAKPFAPVTLRV